MMVVRRRHAGGLGISCTERGLLHRLEIALVQFGHTGDGKIQIIWSAALGPSTMRLGWCHG